MGRQDAAAREGRTSPESATLVRVLMPRFYRSRRFWLILLVVAVVAAGLAAFLAFGPPRLLAKSESPEFCSSCHVMESRYEAWFHAGAHRRVKCVDCHLPNDNIVHHLWRKKSSAAARSSWPSTRACTPRTSGCRTAAPRTLKANCLRCHAETMARVNEDRNCWFCHRQLRHRQTGVVATLPPQPQP